MKLIRIGKTSFFVVTGVLIAALCLSIGAAVTLGILHKKRLTAHEKDLEVYAELLGQAMRSKREEGEFSDIFYDINESVTEIRDQVALRDVELEEKVPMILKSLSDINEGMVEIRRQVAVKDKQLREERSRISKALGKSLRCRKGDLIAEVWRIESHGSLHNIGTAIMKLREQVEYQGIQLDDVGSEIVKIRCYQESEICPRAGELGEMHEQLASKGNDLLMRVSLLEQELRDIETGSANQLSMIPLDTAKDANGSSNDCFYDYGPCENPALKQVVDPRVCPERAASPTTLGSTSPTCLKRAASLTTLGSTSPTYLKRAASSVELVNGVNVGHGK